MGYQEKLVYCDNCKDTKKFLEMLKEKKGDGFQLYAALTVKEGWNAKYKKMKGMVIGQKKFPFTFTSVLEIENRDKIYWQQPKLNMDPDSIGEGHSLFYFGNGQEHFFSKDDMLIWIGGNRGNIYDAYSMFDFYDKPLDNLASELMLMAYDAGIIPDKYIKNGKIDIVKAKPFFKKKVAKMLLTAEEYRVCSKVKTMDLDGIENYTIIDDPSFFRCEYLCR